MKPKNILVITDSVYPCLNANSAIAYRIAEVLTQTYGCRITALAVSSAPVFYEPKEYQKIVPELVDDWYWIYHMKETSKNQIAFLSSLAKKPKLLPYYLDRQFASRTGADVLEYPYQKAYERAVRRLMKHRHFDCIFCFVQPKAIAKALVNVHPSVPCIVYKLDPWTTNPLLPSQVTQDQMKVEAAYEKKFDTLCSHILTTAQVYQDMEKLGAPMEKYTVVEFPNILRPVKHDASIAFDRDHIHCVYTGIFYSDIRNPDYVLSLFEKLADTNILFHIFGPANKAIPDRLPNNVIFHGQVTQEEANDYAMEADILVNVGNAIANMVPSKLLTYISVGKPILNLTKIDNCPTVPQMEKYPLGLTLRETAQPEAADVDKVRDFIVSSRGKSIPFAEIEKRHYEATPAYVAKQVYSLMEQISSR